MRGVMTLKESLVAVSSVLEVELSNLQLVKERQLKAFCNLFGIRDYKGKKIYFNQSIVVVVGHELFEAIRYVKSDSSQDSIKFKIEIPDCNVFIVGLSYLNDYMLQEALLGEAPV